MCAHSVWTIYATLSICKSVKLHIRVSECSYCDTGQSQSDIITVTKQELKRDRAKKEIVSVFSWFLKAKKNNRFMV